MLGSILLVLKVICFPRLRSIACNPATAVTTRPAVVICNGDYAEQPRDFGQAVAALVDGGNCSSLSLTACSIGNVGAVALAKACYRKGLEELCLESCAIGNAGAAALLVALGEGTTNQKLMPLLEFIRVRNTCAQVHP